MSNQDLVNSLVSRGILKTPRIISAFAAVDRREFVTKTYETRAYYDTPLPIGYGQTISQPTTVAIMLEKLRPRNGDRVLDIGSGSGWTTALLSFIVGEKGSVLGLERIPELVDFGKRNLSKYNFHNASIRKAGTDLGVPGENFDKILVSASAKELPDTLIKQLKSDGRMVIPIQHSLWVLTKKNDRFHKEEIPGFVFVPLL